MPIPSLRLASALQADGRCAAIMRGCRARRGTGNATVSLRRSTDTADEQDGMEGASAADAARRAAALMGNVTLAREEARAAWMAPWLESVWQDLRYGLRHLRAHPAFTITTGGDVAAGDGAEYQLLHRVQRDGAADLAGAGRRASRHRPIEIGRTRRRGRRVDVRLRRSFSNRLARSPPCLRFAAAAVASGRRHRRQTISPSTSSPRT